MRQLRLLTAVLAIVAASRCEGSSSTPVSVAAGRRLLLAGAHEITVIDAETGSTIADIPVGRPGVLGPCAIAVAGSHAYVITCGGGEVSIIDLNINEVVGTIGVICCAVSISASPDGLELYVLSEELLEEIVTVIDVATLRTIRTMTFAYQDIVRDSAVVDIGNAPSPSPVLTHTPPSAPSPSPVLTHMAPSTPTSALIVSTPTVGGSIGVNKESGRVGCMIRDRQSDGIIWPLHLTLALLIWRYQHRNSAIILLILVSLLGPTTSGAVLIAPNSR